ncbi:hypothetical protein ALO37_200064 [Pseudomonas savastanoi pv. glycinea]|uniref:Uncharacterized protein n=1 Tax=Pseudomonas savastanoi pv. glycinea TaxID=318 RepID=A0A0P9QY61_PSESG|nr:hypothetical protein ALO37_200064 [Pseudomonas savastanoi pv. glycinea]RMM90676.1 hypothetical protein ALQ70_200018 [Pseudomonas savastanoi pv. glycinea]RMO38071.1 hypothetical protein ALQ41_200260 [Pseudomonas savastanoi pv. glycinea]
MVINPSPAHNSSVIIFDRDAPMSLIHTLRYILMRNMNFIKLDKVWTDSIRGSVSSTRSRDVPINLPPISCKPNINPANSVTR